MDRLMPYLLSGTFIAVFSVLLFFDFQRKSGAAGAEQIGTIVSTRDLAQRKYGSGVVWESIERRTPVYDGDSLRTAAGSGAVVRLSDGSAIELDENSMILLSMTRESLDVHFTGGSVVARKASGAEGARELNLVSDKTKISVGSGDLSVTKDRDTVNLSVSSGMVSVVSGEKGKIDITSGNTAVVSSAGTTEVAPVTLELLNPVPGASVISGEKGVRFAGRYAKEAGPVILTVGRDRGMGSVAGRVPMKDGVAYVRLRPGHYYCALSGRKKGGAGSGAGPVVAFDVIHHDPAGLIAPRYGETVNYAERPSVLLKWSQDPAASEYRVSVSTKENFSAIFSDVTTADSSIMVDLPGDGEYFWAVEKKTGTAVETIRSRTGHFYVRKNVTFAPPQPFYPKKNAVLPLDSIKRKGLVFSWKSDPPGGLCRLTVTREGDEAEPVIDITTKSGYLRHRGTLPEGRYSWSIGSVPSGGYPASVSESRSFTVRGNVVIRNIEPERGRLFACVSGGNLPVRFSWEGSGGDALYTLELVSAESGKVIRTLQVGEPQVTMERVVPGKYSWRVKQFDEQGDPVAESGETPYRVIEKPVTPKILSPYDGETVNLRRKDHILFRWKGGRGISYYRITLYRGNGGRWKPVFMDRTKGNEYRFEKLKLMDYGSFMWDVRAFTAYNGGSGADTVESEVASGSFSVTLGERLKKPVIVSPGIIYRK